MSQQSQVAKIKYVKFVRAKRNYKNVSHVKLNDWSVSDFTKNGMFESLLNLEYVRLYFDFDFHEDDEIVGKVKEIFELLDEIKNIFGEYAFAGYCCDKELYDQLDKEFKKQIELKTVNLGKPLSFHVVFYESMISQNELCEIMNKDKKINNKIKDFADLNVYKNADKEQLLRHPYANKYGEPYERNELELKGVNFDNLKEPFDSAFLVATPRGNEKLISRDQWITIFNESKKSEIINEEVGARILKELEMVDTKNVKEIDYDEIIEEINNYHYKIIEEINVIDDPKCLELMLKCFEPIYSSLVKLCCIIGASPFDKEILLKYFNSWYFFEGHTHDNLGTVNGYFKKYYKYEESNKWFYICLKHLNDDVKHAFLNKFSFNTVDESIKMDIWETFTLKNIIKNIEENKYYTFTKNVITDKKLVKKAKELNEKKYGIEIIKTVNDDDTTKTTITINKYPKINYGKLITDLKKCFVIIDQTPMIYIFKDLDGSSGNFKISETHKEAVACNKLKNRKLTYLDRELKEKSISLWDIIMQNNNSRHFTYSDSAFYSQNPDVFSYYYNPFRINKDFDIEVDETKTDRTTMNNIELFLDHVKNVIAAGDETSYNYIKNWIIRPLQMPNKKNKSALIFAGIDQGTGKSWTAEIIARLHGRFGEENIGNMKDICGDFNAKLLNKTLVVANEVKDVDNSVWYNGDALKSLITDDKVGIEKKGIDSMTCDNNINFIFVSNNKKPINIDDKDRRYAVFEPKPIHDKDDFDYWTDEFYLLKDDQQFLEDLYNWCLKQDISKFNPRNIPITEAKLNLIENNKSRHEEFIIEHLEHFNNGWERDDCFETYVYWCGKKKITNPGQDKTFKENLSNYIIWSKQKDSKTGKEVRILPKKRFMGKVKFYYQITQETYENLKQYALIDNEEEEIED